ncbi:tetratricopeptide repeat protein [Kitasatospora sp. NBC_01250]|uniref:tetratricopeptide repeat protein n=1 Tax=Kitasatospora sp. NBC_01250 TaxID=2903571 RepID=UPI002E2F34B9|nr:tetratricopeptide repeat protein [Kitasatospora sp. NBC_01250]
MTAPHPLVEQAAALMELDRFDEARVLLARRLAEDPTDVRGWVRLARCHLSVREYEEVLAATGEALALAPEDFDAHQVRAYALRRLGRPDESLAAAQEAVRIDPQRWQGFAALSESLIAWQPRWPEAFDAAAQAVRLGPQETGAHYALWKAALVNGRADVLRQALLETLRIDPQNAWALGELAAHAAKDAAGPPLTGAGARLPAAADAYATALAADPQDAGLRRGLDAAVFRMLRGTRWLALLCAVIAALAGRVFPTGDDPTALPGPLGTRLYGLALMAAVWGFGAWRRYRRLRTGVRMSLWSLVRQVGWARLVVAQSAWCTLTAVLVVTVPWSQRTVPQVLFWVALVPTLLTVRFERAAIRS